MTEKKTMRFEDEPLTKVWCDRDLGSLGYHEMVEKYAEAHYAASGRWMDLAPHEDYRTVILVSLEF
jgi:hypothetical protein